MFGGKKNKLAEEHMKFHKQILPSKPIERASHASLDEGTRSLHLYVFEYLKNFIPRKLIITL